LGVVLPHPRRLLATARISPERLGDLGLGSVGITLNPHFLLDEHGRRTEWLVKRLRAHRFDDPAAKLAEFEHDHRLLERYFACGPGAPQVLETQFVVVDRNFDDHPDYERGREYLMVQRFVRGTTLQEAVEQHPRSAWLHQAVEQYVNSYRTMQREELAIPDCFSIRSEHIKVDPEEQRLVLIDTNNVVLVRRELKGNALFRRYFTAPLEQVTLRLLHEVFAQLCAEFDFDRQQITSSHPNFSFREAGPSNNSCGISRATRVTTSISASSRWRLGSHKRGVSCPIPLPATKSLVDSTRFSAPSGSRHS
jgi:hypothetical protein